LPACGNAQHTEGTLTP